MEHLHPLLDFLSAEQPDGLFDWRGWQLCRMTGGWNNLLYRAKKDASDLVVKFTRRDTRDRTSREFYALKIMQALCPGFAPAPVLLENARYPLQVVVQWWMDGDPCEVPPAVPQEWQRLAEHYVAIHTISPERVETSLLPQLKPAALTFSHADDARRYVIESADRLHQDAWVEDLRRVVNRLKKTRFPTWPDPPCTFDRCDPNIKNFMRLPGEQPWASVDWENSGWGDPAFEIGDMMTHPCYKDVSASQWDCFLQLYAESSLPDARFFMRARAYYAIILVRWAYLFAGYAYQRACGVQSTGRLVAWPQSWWDGVPGEYQRYVNAAENALDEFPTIKE